MKKLIFILSFLGMTFSGAYAQSESEGGFTQRSISSGRAADQGRSLGKGINAVQKHNSFELSIGPRIGGGVAIASQQSGFDVTKGAGFGFDAGLGVNMRFGGKDSKGRPLDGRGWFGAGIELNYAMRSIGTNGDKSLTLSYFDVPVLFQFYPGYATKQLRNLYLEVGPTFSALLSASPKVLTTETHEFSTGNLKGGDIKVTFGLGYRFTKAASSGFYLNFRYNLGTSDLAGNFPVKTSSAELTLGYLFKCAGGSKGNAAKAQQTSKNLNKITF